MQTDSPPTASASPSVSPGRRRPPAASSARPWVIGGAIVVLLVAVGALAMRYWLVSDEGRDAGALLYEASRSSLQVTVTAEGNVESASNIEVRCRVAGGSTILWIIEDGKLVSEGDVIVKMDTSAIEDKLSSQRITYEKAQATEIQAREELEAAVISVKEYEEGTYLEQLKQSEADVQIALENLRSAENQLKYSERMARKGFVSSLQREADEFAVERAKLDLDAANTRKKVLVEFTRPKMVKDLEAKREAASAKLRSEQAGLQLEKARLDRFQDQLKNCEIRAPQSGMVVYANDSRSGSRFGSSQQAAIEEGAAAREGQTLVRIPDLANMQVKVTIHESRVEQVRPGLPAQVVIQDQEHKGRVLSVANQPQPGSWLSANVKEYATTVAIEGQQSGLKPGMTAKVTILVDNVADALTLPVSCVVEQRGTFHCWVKTPAGPERRPLQLGKTNDKLIEVLDGIKVGDLVYRNPRAMIEEARREPQFEAQVADKQFDALPPQEAAATRSSRPEGGRGDGPTLPGGERPGPGVGTADAGAPGGAPGDGSGRGEGGPGGPAERGGPGGGRSGRGSFDILQFDKNGDKQISLEELPERMQGMMERMDTNGDGVLDEAEIARLRQRRPGGGGGGGRPEGPGGAGERPAGGGEEPGPGPTDESGGRPSASGAGAAPR